MTFFGTNSLSEIAFYLKTPTRKSVYVDTYKKKTHAIKYTLRIRNPKILPMGGNAGHLSDNLAVFASLRLIFRCQIRN